MIFCITDPHSIGLRRDDGLIAVNIASGPTAEKKFFKENSLKIITDANLIQTDFLGITLNLQAQKFWPYRKPRDTPLYINFKSKNETPATVKNSNMPHQPT